MLTNVTREAPGKNTGIFCVCYITCYCIWKQPRVGEMVHQLRALVVLPRTRIPLSASLLGGFRSPESPSPGDLVPSPDLCRRPYVCGMSFHRHKQINKKTFYFQERSQLVNLYKVSSFVWQGFCYDGGLWIWGSSKIGRAIGRWFEMEHIKSTVRFGGLRVSGVVV